MILLTIPHFIYNEEMEMDVQRGKKKKTVLFFKDNKSLSALKNLG